MALDLGSLLQQYAGGSARPDNVEEHFDQVAQAAPPDVMKEGLAEAFRSDGTPPFGQMVGQLFGSANPGQRAGMLSSLLAGLAPAVLSSLASGGGSGLGAILGRLRPGADAAPALTPEDAAKLTPADVEQIAQHAEKSNPGIIDQISGFAAEHPQLVKSLGAAALGIAMSRMANRR